MFNEIRAASYSQVKTGTRISMVLVNDQQDVQQAIDFWSGLVDEFAYR